MPTPLVVMATSTLEIGVDIDNLALVLQYSSHPHSVDLVQRFGRSGRHLQSFLVSTLVLVLRNSGEDIRYVLDQDAVEYVYNFEIPHIRDVLKDEKVMVRSLTWLYSMQELVGTEEEQIIEEFLNILEASLGPGYKDSLQLWKEIILTRYPPITSQSSEIFQKHVENAKKYFSELWGPVIENLMKIKRQDVINEMKRIYLRIRQLDRLDCSVPRNLIPLIVDIDSLYQILRKVTKDKNIELDIRDSIERYLGNLSLTIHELVYAIVSQLSNLLTEDEIKRFVWSHIPPGMTSYIGELRPTHFIYRGTENIRPKEVDINEAFKKIRPLHTSVQ
jgi:hypothetical protein